MYWNVILKVPGGLNISDPTWQAANADVLYEIRQYDAKWPTFITPDTKVVNGYKLINTSVLLPTDNPVGLMTALFINYELDWTVLACQSLYAMEDVLDVDQNVVGRKALVEKAIDSGVYPYLEKRYTYNYGEEATGELTPEINWFHVWVGCSPWVSS